MEFQNERYEYQVRESATVAGQVAGPWDDEMRRDGWCVAWRDIATEGTFTVYRRERP